ncbi:hypothetical protein F0U62_35620 [Cystobacter fuscus]|uniref:hypothetical protein n=1 Tax=Cystobacter fuscus TaxID=43 RepID=UPI002B28FF14|nr:hypothetical protein F0U62_35620 [Cystobacter fuscus]
MSLSALVLGVWLVGALPPGASAEEARGEGPVAPEVLARCHADMERVLGEAARFGSVQRRAQALLAGLSTACGEVLPERLREGAGVAASARRAERSRRLLEAARGFVPEACLSSEPARAREVEALCPPPEDTLFVRPLPDSLDTGSYAFALAVRARLRERGAYDARSQRWVAEFLLRSALDAEAEAHRATRRSD